MKLKSVQLIYDIHAYGTFATKTLDAETYGLELKAGILRVTRREWLKYDPDAVICIHVSALKQWIPWTKLDQRMHDEKYMDPADYRKKYKVKETEEDLGPSEA